MENSVFNTQLMRVLHMSQTTITKPFAVLDGANFLLLTTYRKTGVAVPTPVWFAQEGEKLYVTTHETAGKLKRLRHTARVEVAPCTPRGDVTGGTAAGTARILPEAERSRAEQILIRKYGWQKRMFNVFLGLRGRWKTMQYIEISPAQ
jgi:hypothetical protein